MYLKDNSSAASSGVVQALRAWASWPLKVGRSIPSKCQDPLIQQQGIISYHIISQKTWTQSFDIISLFKIQILILVWLF